MGNQEARALGLGAGLCTGIADVGAGHCTGIADVSDLELAETSADIHFE